MAASIPQFYIVATPIGNRDDITTRAMQLLSEVDFIVAEDTRHTGQLLAFYGIKKPLLSFRDAPTPIMKRLLDTITHRLKQGEQGAYVTDAGTPGISDPGWRLVQTLIHGQIQVVPIPGASALTSILSVSDVPLEEFRFVGFLPKKKGYQTKLEDIITYLQHKEVRGVILYESPARIRRTLEDILKLDGNLGAIVGRELTKKFETIYRGKLTSSFIETLPQKGEYVVLLYNLQGTDTPR